MFLAVKKFRKIIFGSCSNCKLVDVKNRSHDSPGAWERFILDSQTKGEVYYQHIMGNHLNLACLVSGLLFSCSKGRNEAIKAWPIHLPIHPLTHAHTLIIIPIIIQNPLIFLLPKPQFWRKKAKSRSIEGEEVRSNKKAATWRLGFTLFFLFALFFLFVYLGFISIMFVNSAMRE